MASMEITSFLYLYLHSKKTIQHHFFYEFLLPVILHFTYFIITHFIYYSSSFITVFSLNLKSFQTSLSNLQLQLLLQQNVEIPRFVI